MFILLFPEHKKHCDSPPLKKNHNNLVFNILSKENTFQAFLHKKQYLRWYILGLSIMCFLACTPQLVQHQISGSKEVLEMGKNMASSLKCRRYKPDSGTAGSLGFSSHSNASSSICSVNPVPDLSDSSVMSFPTASTQTSSSGSGSCSDTSLSREKIERQSFKIQFL